MSSHSRLYYGPMKSGKSKVLIEHANHLTKQGYAFLAIKPWTDTRDGAWIKSRETRLEPVPARQVAKAIDILTALETKTVTHVLIDEIFLLDSAIIQVYQHLCQQGITVIAGGLDRDFRGEWFPLADYASSRVTMEAVLHVFEFAEELTAPCHVCQAPALFTQRLIDGQPAAYDSPLILIGDQEYQPRCNDCHRVPGRQPALHY